ncbi:hypothetical protein [Parashewanella tropica]|uniref:hypothetical protein n=1 Tax=Parashewanella tropica TaxID=2547970 RepID=UPI00105A4440|nr:hypothetical protein [Parashewanella tropica]
MATQECMDSNRVDYDSASTQPLLQEKSPNIQGYQAVPGKEFDAKKGSVQVVHSSYFNSPATNDSTPEKSKCRKVAEYGCKVSPFAICITLGMLALILIQDFDNQLGLSDLAGEAIGVAAFLIAFIIGLGLTALTWQVPCDRGNANNYSRA